MQPRQANDRQVTPGIDLQNKRENKCVMLHDMQKNEEKNVKTVHVHCYKTRRSIIYTGIYTGVYRTGRIRM